MAYVSQELKKKIAGKLRNVVPDGWKYSLSVRNHSTLVMTISAGPESLCIKDGERQSSFEINHHYLDRAIDKTVEDRDEIVAVLKKIKSALNTDNHDNSDLHTDYFDVGHYVRIQVGKWDKPYIVNETKKKETTTMSDITNEEKTKLGNALKQVMAELNEQPKERRQQVSNWCESKFGYPMVQVWTKGNYDAVREICVEVKKAIDSGDWSKFGDVAAGQAGAELTHPAPSEPEPEDEPEDEESKLAIPRREKKEQGEPAPKPKREPLGTVEHAISALIDERIKVALRRFEERLDKLEQGCDPSSESTIDVKAEVRKALAEIVNGKS